jgi:hypothetical protein
MIEQLKYEEMLKKVVKISKTHFSCFRRSGCFHSQEGGLS